MRPVDEITPAQWRSLAGVATDLDDTLTHHGALTTAALRALHDLADAKIPCVVATGRPSGWGPTLLRLLPVRAVVTENGGAVSWREGPRVETAFTLDEEALAEGMARVNDAVLALRHAFPELSPVVERCERVTDVVLDIGESRVVDRAVVESALSRATAEGLYAVASTVHLHVSARPPDKGEGLRRALEAIGVAPESFARAWVYVGDSPNDAGGFRAAAVGVGVRGVERFAHEMDPPPAFVTRGGAGEGFAEVARAMIEARA